MKLKYIVFPALFFASIGMAGAIELGVCQLTSCYLGFYKSSAAACTACPEVDRERPYSANGGMAGITSCYYEAGTPFSDETGSYTFTTDCYYKN